MNACHVTSTTRRSRGLEHAGDSFGVSLPFRELRLELCAAFGGELVELRPPIVLGETPVTLDPSLSFEPMQGRVKSAFLDEEDALAPFFDRARNGVTVHRAPRQRSKDEQIERALEQVE